MSMSKVSYELVIEEMKTRYLDGETSSSLAKSFGLSIPTVSAWLHQRASVPKMSQKERNKILRERGDYNPPEKVISKEELVALYIEENRSKSEVARVLSISLDTLNDRLHRYGIEKSVEQQSLS